MSAGKNLQIPARSKDIGEQHKLVHKVADVVNRQNLTIYVILLRRKVDGSKSSEDHVPLFARTLE